MRYISICFFNITLFHMGTRAVWNKPQSADAGPSFKTHLIEAWTSFVIIRHRIRSDSEAHILANTQPWLHNAMLCHSIRKRAQYPMTCLCALPPLFYFSDIHLFCDWPSLLPLVGFQNVVCRLKMNHTRNMTHKYRDADIMSLWEFKV